MNDQATLRLSLGIGLFLVGSILIIYSAFAAWDGWQRWGATNALINSRQAAFQGREREARALAVRAARYQKHAATAVAAINPMEADAQEDVSRLRRTVASGRNELQRIEDYIKILGSQATTINGSDYNAQLLRALQEYHQLQSGSVPELPTTGVGQAADPGIFLRTMEWRLRAAWRVGDQDTLRRSAGQFALLYPTHSVAPYLRLLNSFTPVELNRSHISRLASDRETPDRQLRTAILRAAAQIHPRHRTLIQELIPSEMRSGVELVAAMLNDEAPVEDIVREAIRTKNDDVLETVAHHCLRLNRLDLVNRLGQHGSEDFQRLAKTIVATRTLDLDAVRELGLPVDAIRPRTWLRHSGRDWISFHLSDQQGQIPTVDLTIHLGDAAVPPEQITTVGSLHYIQQSGPTRTTLEIRHQDEVLFSEEVLRR